MVDDLKTALQRAGLTGIPDLGTGLSAATCLLGCESGCEIGCQTGCWDGCTYGCDLDCQPGCTMTGVSS